MTLSTTSSAGILPLTTSITNKDFGVSPELSSFSLLLDTTFNVTGDVVSTLCVARSENMFVS